MADYTAGPWTVTDNSWEVSTVYGPDGETVAECPINSIVTEDNQHELEPIKEANARLIAASPDLLAAAEYQDHIQSPTFKGDPEKAIAKVRQMRRAAIAKARGEMP